ncbi:protein CUP-SHAPED COTYLEDON 3-like [Asparagus officinalis]|uniref:protein CUP-SHAPED COTYLEDON 3-like n=1 Tax=Asparagus officinalis TaxID=4686 RepID=UPI00098E2295|nr:protein CUP-SHAPED COTYLEDON 3-like [Asparagus officinalis]
MGLRDIESTLPPGFRFYPSDEELVCHYLYKKVSNERVMQGTMVEVDLHTREPWELPEVARLNANEWYFFSFRDRKYATGSRTNRATKTGYWKATGRDRTVYDPSAREIVGMRKTLVFYRGRAPNGIKSCWVMHEFRLENPHTPPKEDWVLCRVFRKRKREEEEEMKMSSSSSPQMGDRPLSLAPSVYGGPHQENNHNNSNGNNSSFVDNVANLLQCNFLDFTPQMEMDSCGGDELGLLLDVDLGGKFSGVWEP